MPETSTKNIDLRSLESSFIYLIKGSLEQVSFELRNEPNVEYLLWPSATVAVERLSTPRWDCDRLFLVIVQSKKEDLPKLTRIDSDLVVLYIVADVAGQLDAKAKATVKRRPTPIYRTVDISSKDYSAEPEITAAARECILSPEDRQEVLTKYKSSPRQLKFLLEQRRLFILDSEDAKMRRLSDLFACLAKPEWYEEWNKLTNSDCYAIFVYPSKRKNSAAYKYLTGAGTLNKGACPALWAYLDLILGTEAKPKEPKASLMYFAAWVYFATHLFNTPTHRGLYRYTYGTYEGIGFEPSDQAVKRLLSTLSVDVQTYLTLQSNLVKKASQL